MDVQLDLLRKLSFEVFFGPPQHERSQDLVELLDHLKVLLLLVLLVILILLF
jgi:hypothetical protein